METHNRIMAFDELAVLLAPLHPRYEEGFARGSIGMDPPIDLNHIMQFSSKHEGDSPEGLVVRCRDPASGTAYLISMLEEGLHQRASGRAPVSSIKIDQGKVSFRRGYLDGLTKFMESHKFPGAQSTLDAIATQEGLIGFSRGALLDSPFFHDLYNPDAGNRISQFIIPLSVLKVNVSGLGSIKPTLSRGLRQGFCD